MTIPVGIDLGTTFSVIACYKNSKVEIISDKNGKRVIPSMVFYDPDTGKALVGHLAYDQSWIFPSNLLKDAKRLIGRKFGDKTIVKLQSARQFKLASTETGMVAYRVEIKKEYVLKKPEEVSSEVLKYLKGYAEEYLGEPVTDVVISVPAYFSVSQRMGTLKAAELAGLKVKKFISEPIAGALHYLTAKPTQGKFMVVDFGGGTFDVSLLEVVNGVVNAKAVGGNKTLGGRDIDENLFSYFYKPPKNYKDKKKILRNNIRLEQTCISIKEYLSSNDSIKKIVACFDGDTDLELTMNRTEFETQNNFFFDKCSDIIQKNLNEHGWKITDIENVILVGGSTRIPKFRQLLENIFGQKKIKKDLNPDEAVAGGACLEAENISKGLPSLEKATDITPMSLGIAGYGNLMTVIIPKNSKFPTKGSLDTVTVFNDLKNVKFYITEGEQKNSRYNNDLGTFTLEGLPQKIAGDLKVKITFTLDKYGVLAVNATESSTGKATDMNVIISEFGLSECLEHLSIEELKKIEEEDGIFEKFILRRNDLLKRCRRWTYENEDVGQRCANFIKFAEELDFKCINELNHRFLELEIPEEKNCRIS